MVISLRLVVSASKRQKILKILCFFLKQGIVISLGRGSQFVPKVRSIQLPSSIHQLLKTQMKSGKQKIRELFNVTTFEGGTEEIQQTLKSILGVLK